MNEQKLSKFKFLGYKVTKIECQIEDDFALNPEKINQEINVENNFNNENKKFVEVVLNITVRSESNKFKFFLRLKGGFLAEDDVSEETLKILAEQNAPAILFPFARAIVSTYTAQANIIPIILPLVNFTK